MEAGAETGVGAFAAVVVVVVAVVDWACSLVYPSAAESVPESDPEPFQAVGTVAIVVAVAAAAVAAAMVVVGAVVVVVVAAG